MRMWRKFSAVALALVIVLAFSAVALAENDNVLPNAGVESNNNKSSVGTTVKIPKAIAVHGSADAGAVYSPSIDYTYAIAPVTEANLVDSSNNRFTVTDNASNSGFVKEGPADGVTLSDAVANFTSAKTALGDGNVTLVPSSITVSVDLSKFNVANYGPGVYRYAITSDNTSVVYAAGVTPRGNADRDNRYLDVYIKNASSEGLEVYGFVLLDSNVSVNTSNANEVKSPGFATDDYWTVDVSVTKTITGDAANTTHQFPFSISVNNNGLGYLYAKESENLADDGSTTALNTNLSHNQVFHIRGLNPKATVTYTETNDTPDTYQVTVTGLNSASIVSQTPILPKTGTQATSALPVTTYDSVNTSANVVNTKPVNSDNTTVTFNNHLDAISPTGVVLRYAPYFAMMGAGIVALPLSIRRKKEDF